MTITEIYTAYNIMPSLQMHMYRVSGVARSISSSITGEHNERDIISACLLHDMGNILKFNLDLFPEFLEPEGREYWQKVKEEYRLKYGPDEHEATLQIVKELGMSQRVYDLVDAFSFSKAKENVLSKDLDRMICAYSDMRVEPHGVVSLEKRLQDGKKRFRLNKLGQSSEELFQEMSGYLRQMEDYLFANATLQPSHITEESVKQHLTVLSQFKL